MQARRCGSTVNSKENAIIRLLLKLAITGSAAYLGLQATRALVRTKRKFEWKNKRVLITGGSRGLGLVIARILADQGARLAITSRNQIDLDVAAKDLRMRGADVIANACDVRDQHQVGTFIHDVVEQFGGVDVLMNVAGIISVGPV